MIEIQAENKQRAERSLEQFGENWILAITQGALDRLEQLCHPKITGRLLIPAGLVTVTGVAELIAEYRVWFGECSDFSVEARRVARLGGRLGIGYRFLLQEHGEWYRIEQQLFCVLKDSRVQQLYLLCSGFQPADSKTNSR
jgi:hypothetical protein